MPSRWSQYMAFCTFIWRSKNEHAVHSPFVFSLWTQCVYRKTPKAALASWQAYRASLVSDHSLLWITDFGAGSKVFRSPQRSVAAIAKNAGISARNAALLTRICAYLAPQNILEIGTSLGLSTVAMALGNPKAQIISLEGCPATAAVAQSRLLQFGYDTTQIVVGSFQSLLPHYAMQTFDLIYFDGNHQKAATWLYFETLLATATNDSIWIFDDIHWSPDMEAVWRAIQDHPKVTVTIDTFAWGMVFFRKEQAKQHFVLRS